VRSLNWARHSRFSVCSAPNKIGCSPIVSRTPRRADGRRSRLPVRCSLNKIGYSLLSGRIPHTTAGSRPPLLVRVRWFPNMTGLLLHTVGNTRHGGPTPAALGHVRLCTADGALFSGRSSCTRSGRRKPTVENVRDCTGVSNPRRAHARRSWPRALVHRKNRFSPADIRTANQERGASAPRGFRKRACNDDPPIRG
jgi:hypothetical protein